MESSHEIRDESGREGENPTTWYHKCRGDVPSRQKSETLESNVPVSTVNGKPEGGPLSLPVPLVQLIAETKGT